MAHLTTSIVTVLGSEMPERFATLAIAMPQATCGDGTYRDPRALGPNSRPSGRKQVYDALYRGQAADLVQISNLAAPLCGSIWPRTMPLGLPEIARVYDSVDGTRRYLLRLSDGRTVETVLMPEGERDTICISSQVGCPVDCKFCMTALLGLERNLTAGEIVGPGAAGGARQSAAAGWRRGSTS